MPNFSFSSEEEEVFAKKGEEKLYKRPEFILIDDQSEQKRYTYFGSDSTRKPISEEKVENNSASQEKGSHSLRFVCLLGLIFCLVFGCGILLWSVVLSCLAAISLFRNHTINQGTKSFWKIFKNTVIAGFGFTLGLLSPTLGLGLIAIYFSITDELINEDFLHKIIKNSLYKG